MPAIISTATSWIRPAIQRSIDLSGTQESSEEELTFGGGIAHVMPIWNNFEHVARITFGGIYVGGVRVYLIMS
jgi:hypothetical protein